MLASMFTPPWFRTRAKVAVALRRQEVPASGRWIMESDRRRFLAASAALGIITLGMTPAPVRGDDKKPEREEEVSAAEDLMREHGVLNRILLIYEEGLRRLRVEADVPP